MRFSFSHTSFVSQAVLIISFRLRSTRALPNSSPCLRSRFSTKCAMCSEGITPGEVVQKAQDNVYHEACFSCITCSQQLAPGDQYFLLDDRRLMCKTDFEAAKARGKKRRGIAGYMLNVRWVSMVTGNRRSPPTKFPGPDASWGIRLLA